MWDIWSGQPKQPYTAGGIDIASTPEAWLAFRARVRDIARQALHIEHTAAPPAGGES